MREETILCIVESHCVSLVATLFIYIRETIWRHKWLQLQQLMLTPHSSCGSVFLHVYTHTLAHSLVVIPFPLIVFIDLLVLILLYYFCNNISGQYGVICSCQCLVFPSHECNVCDCFMISPHEDYLPVYFNTHSLTHTLCACVLSNGSFA